MKVLTNVTPNGDALSFYIWLRVEYNLSVRKHTRLMFFKRVRVLFQKHVAKIHPTRTHYQISWCFSARSLVTVFTYPLALLGHLRSSPLFMHAQHPLRVPSTREQSQSPMWKLDTNQNTRRKWCAERRRRMATPCVHDLQLSMPLIRRRHLQPGF